MKQKNHKYLLAIIFLLVILLNAHSQKTFITAEPIGLFWNGNLRVDFESPLNKSLSLKFGIEYGEFTSSRQGGSILPSPSSSIDEATEAYSVQGWGFMPEFRYYFLKKKEAPRGLFCGLYLRCRSFTEQYENDYNNTTIEAKGSSTNIGVSAGYKFVFGRFIMEPLLGYGTSSIKWKDEYDHNRVDDFYTKNLNQFGSLRFELNLGIALGKRKQE